MDFGPGFRAASFSCVEPEVGGLSSLFGLICIGFGAWGGGGGGGGVRRLSWARVNINYRACFNQCGVLGEAAAA